MGTTNEEKRPALYKYVNIPAGERFNPDRPSFETACGGSRTQGSVLNYLVSKACYVAKQQKLESYKVISISVDRAEVLKILRISEQTYIACLRALNAYKYIDSKRYARGEYDINLETINEGIQNPPEQKRRGRPKGSSKKSESNSSSENTLTLSESALTYTQELEQKVKGITGELKELELKVISILTFQKELELKLKELELSSSHEPKPEAARWAFFTPLDYLDSNEITTEEREGEQEHTATIASSLSLDATLSLSFQSNDNDNQSHLPQEGDTDHAQPLPALLPPGHLDRGGVVPPVAPAQVDSGAPAGVPDAALGVTSPAGRADRGAVVAGSQGDTRVAAGGVDALVDTPSLPDIDPARSALDRMWQAVDAVPDGKEEKGQRDEENRDAVIPPGSSDRTRVMPIPGMDSSHPSDQDLRSLSPASRMGLETGKEEIDEDIGNAPTEKMAVIRPSKQTSSPPPAVEPGRSDGPASVAPATHHIAHLGDMTATQEQESAHVQDRALLLDGVTVNDSGQPPPSPRVEPGIIPPRTIKAVVVPKQPEGPPIMPPADAPWCAETIVQMCEARRGRRYPNGAKRKSDRERDVQLDYAKQLATMPDIDREKLLKAAQQQETRHDGWWMENNGYITPRQLVEKDRIHNMLDELQRLERKGQFRIIPKVEPQLPPRMPTAEELKRQAY